MIDPVAIQTNSQRGGRAAVPGAGSSMVAVVIAPRLFRRWWGRPDRPAGRVSPVRRAARGAPAGRSGTGGRLLDGEAGHAHVPTGERQEKRREQSEKPVQQQARAVFLGEGDEGVAVIGVEVGEEDAEEEPV